MALPVQSERRTALSRSVCGLIFIHALEREMGIANVGNHLAYSKMHFWESRFHVQQGNCFLQVQGFRGRSGVFQPLGV